MKEQFGGAGKYNPKHYKATHGEDPESPNQYTHKIAEAHYRVTNSQGKATLGATEIRHAIGKRLSNQTQRGGKRYRYTEENTVDLGSTDTGQKRKKTDTVTINPVIDKQPVANHDNQSKK